MIVYVESDEMYPVYFYEEEEKDIFVQNFGIPITVSEETKKRWDDVTASFYKLQQEIKALVDSTLEKREKIVKDSLEG